MSQLTAHTILPLFAALPLEEQQAFLKSARKLVSPIKPVTKKSKTGYENINAICKPENKEQLVSAIMHNIDFSVAIN